KVAALEQTVATQHAEIARLKGLKGRPALKPSGMEKASEPKPPDRPKGRRGPVTPRVAVEDRILALTVLRRFRRSGPGLAGLLHPLSPGALVDPGWAADRGAAAERG